MIQITAPNSSATDIQLACLINRACLLIFIQHVDVCVRDRIADWDVTLAGKIARQVKQRHDAGGFRLSEHVNVMGRMIEVRHPLSRNLAQERFARGKHQSQPIIEQFPSFILRKTADDRRAIAPK